MNILSISSAHSSSKSWSNSTFLVFREGSELAFTYNFATWDLKQHLSNFSSLVLVNLVCQYLESIPLHNQKNIYFFFLCDVPGCDIEHHASYFVALRLLEESEAELQHTFVNMQEDYYNFFVSKNNWVQSR